MVNDLEKRVRFIIKRHRPVEKTAAAIGHPAWLQLLVPAVHKPSAEDKGTQTESLGHELQQTHSVSNFTYDQVLKITDTVTTAH